MHPIEKGVNQIGQPLLTFSCETTYVTNFNIVPFLAAIAANTPASTRPLKPFATDRLAKQEVTLGAHIGTGVCTLSK
jgi:hypothetical protein